jgi:asparagine synthase (glutamine-hydrolysing)
MCGICGVWGQANGRAVDAMVRAMAHRGPDDAGRFDDDFVSLGMARLAVIDLTPGGHQPMANEDGSVRIVYNGEAYNFQSERKYLESKGHRFRSASDTEVVLRMYEEFGDDLVLRLRGMFAVAVYDKRRGSRAGRLLLARDHFGIKPLLYATCRGGGLVFASEIKALLASGLVEPAVDPEGLRLLLTHGSLSQPSTILRGVKMLPPAHRLIATDGTFRVERYWSLESLPGSDLGSLPLEALAERVEAVLKDSVRAQLVSDRPVGAFLSGGIDSSLLVALMAQEATSRVRTFSVGYEAEGKHLDETDAAQNTANFLGTDHSRVCIRGSEVRDLLPHIAWSLDQPSVDGVNSYFVSKAAKQSVTVAISGNGGDELFAGYPWFALMQQDVARRTAKPWSAIARALVSRAARWRVLDWTMATPLGSAVTRARALDGFAARFASLYQVFGSHGTARLLAPDIRREASVGRSLAADYAPLDELPAGTTIQRASALCLRGYNANQLLRDIDAVSMAHSLEVRVPFLDPEVARLALALPDRAKLGTAVGLPARGYTYHESGAKRVLFEVGRNLLPASIDRQEKRGFGMPFDHWLRGPIEPLLKDALAPQRIRRRGLLVPARVKEEVENALAGRGLWMRPWLLLMVELWCTEVLDRPVQDVGHPIGGKVETRPVSGRRLDGR